MKEYPMNTNAIIACFSLLGFLLALSLGWITLRHSWHHNNVLLLSISVFFLIAASIATVIVAQRMSSNPRANGTATPLPAQTQLILEQSDQQGKVYSRSSLSARDGRENWQHAPSGECQQEVGHKSEIVYIGTAVDNDVVYHKMAYPTQGLICLSASSLKDGTLRWQTPFKSSQSGDNLRGGTDEQLKLLVVDGKAYFYVDNDLYVVRTADGVVQRIIRSTKVGNDEGYVASFVVDNNLLVLDYGFSTATSSLGEQLVVQRADDGTTLWKSALGQYQTPLLLSGRTLVIQSRHTGELVGLNPANGTVLWHSSVKDLTIFALSASQERVYLRANDSGTEDRTRASTSVYAISTLNGQTLWKVAVDPWDGNAPTEADGVTYIADTNTLLAVRSTDGKLLWQYKETPHSPSSMSFDPYTKIHFAQPVVVNGVLFVTLLASADDPRYLRLIPSFTLGRDQLYDGVLALRTSDGFRYWYHEVKGAQLIAVR